MNGICRKGSGEIFSLGYTSPFSTIFTKFDKKVSAWQFFSMYPSRYQHINQSDQIKIILTNSFGLNKPLTTFVTQMLIGL